MAQLEQYRIFEAVARSGGFCRAAEELYITQPAVSRTIKLLESELNTQLFIRNSRGVELTTSGRELYSYIEQALSLIRTAEEHINDIEHLEGGTLSIGGSDTLCRHYLLPYLRKFHDMYPHVALKVTNRTSKETVELLKQGRADIGFINMPTDTGDGISIRPIIELHDCFVYNPAHFPYISGREISLQELSSLPLLMLETESSTRRYVDAYCRGEGVTLQPMIELGSHDLLISFAQIGLGVASVVSEYCGEALNSGQLESIKLAKPIATRSIGLIRKKNLPLSPAAKEFLRMMSVEEAES